METTGIKFRVNFGEETRPVIENITFPLDKSDSLFKEQYKKVFEEIERFLTLKPNKQKNNCLLKQNESINNIMAFIGERGSGKTSCMMSVANSLINKMNDSFGKYPIINAHNFHSIDLIDPSFFDKTNNILSIIIAKLFRKFKDHEEQLCNKSNCNFENKRQLVEIFQKVQTNLNCVIGGKHFSDDDLEQLISLSASTNLRADIEELIKTYLGYMYNSEDVLVIMVDDIDLNTQYSYVMVEQIRKYFIHPNVIILLAVKIDQLANVMKSQYAKEFDILLSREQITFEPIEEMVEKYLSKLIPHPQRLFLPDLEAFHESHLTIIYRKENGEEDKREFHSIREAIPMLIFEKTRYLFYNSLGTTSYIIPRNLRELRHLINLLWNMNTYEKDNDSEYNKTLFKKYFFETWVSNNLDVKGREFIKNILDITDAILINKSIIGLLKKRFDNVIKLIQETNLSPELKSIIRDDNVTYNISLGDVMALIYYLENVTEKVEDQKFLFMIKSIYSMRLYEYYDQITEEQPNTKNREKEVMKNDYLKKLSNYIKLSGGNFINSNMASLLPDSTDTGKRGQRIINGGLFYTLLNDIISNRVAPDVYQLNLIELFALTISRLDDKNTFYRVKQEVYYNSMLDNSNLKNLYFDITAFTYNLAFAEKAYARFHKDLYSICQNRSDSLLSRINNKIESRYPNDKKHSWMSWICIRNAEVLQDFVLYLENNKPKGANNSLEVIRNFFLSASKFQILSYDFQEESDDHYDINFSFLSEISSALERTDTELAESINLFENLFTAPSSNLNASSSIRKAYLNIRLNLRGRSYSKNEVWRRLSKKNADLNMISFQVSFDELFNQEINYQYPTQEVNNLLRLYKLKVESL